MDPRDIEEEPLDGEDDGSDTDPFEDDDDWEEHDHD